MRRAALILALSLIAHVCPGVIGDMTSGDVLDYPQRYCSGGQEFPWDGPTLIIAGAKYNRLWNFPAIFHGLMCRLSHYCLPEYDPNAQNMQGATLPGCATPVVRQIAARTPYPTITNRNDAVGQLVPFFAAGGPTNVGLITVGPLQHAYGGSPLSVWPAAEVVDVTPAVEGGPRVTAATVQGATPLRAGIGRGGCFDTVGWLTCTDAAARPHGFYVQGKHPMADLGAFFYSALSPYFSVDFATNGIPAPLVSYSPSFYLTNSPAYLSPEAVPTNTASPVLTIEPWRRSWEALGGLSCLPWHTNTNAFEYEAVDVWTNGVVTSWSSNAVVFAIRFYMQAGHPSIYNRDYFPTNGYGVTKIRYWGPQGYNNESVRPTGDYDPRYIFYRGPGGVPAGNPIDFDLSYTFTATNVNERILTAPESNRVVAVTNALRATSVKRWKFEKTNEIDGGKTIIERGTVTNDFGYGEHEYTYEKYVQGPVSYDWALVSESEPVTHVDFCGVTNTMRTAVRAQLRDAYSWAGFPIYSGFADVSRAFTVVRYDDGGGVMGTSGRAYFMSGSGNLFGGGYSQMFDFMHVLVGQTVELWDIDLLSENAHPVPRQPVLMNTASPPWWDTVWGGNGNNYTIKTFGPPQSFRSPGGETNITYTAIYDDTLHTGLWWEDTIFCREDGSVVMKTHQLEPAGSGGEEQDDTTMEDATGFVPVDISEAKSEITFTIENWLEEYYRVKWEPVRAWGIYHDVTGHADWPQ